MSKPNDSKPCNEAALRKAARAVSHLYDSRLGPTGLRSTQRSILITIGQIGSPLVRDLAECLALDPSSLRRALKPLIRDGLVSVAADSDDRRCRRVVLTGRGDEKMAECRDLWCQAQDRFEQTIGEERARALREALAVIARLDF